MSFKMSIYARSGRLGQTGHCTHPLRARTVIDAELAGIIGWLIRVLNNSKRS